MPINENSLFSETQEILDKMCASLNKAVNNFTFFAGISLALLNSFCQNSIN